MATETRTPLEKPPYAEALKRTEDALTPNLGRNIGKGWVFNGGNPYVTRKGKLLYNLMIQPENYLHPAEETELFHVTGIDATMDFLEEVDLLGVAHFVVGQDEDYVEERLRTL